MEKSVWKPLLVGFVPALVLCGPLLLASAGAQPNERCWTPTYDVPHLTEARVVSHEGQLWACGLAHPRGDVALAPEPVCGLMVTAECP